ncbi:uncharacterized protein PHACADRAFT_167243 [Phanerochaete carnosa HHB-10118-sp]|nr:uncharacterized protein PHACADRAFT_167243 [Phanerochaete carnosa HHB-10118-sp]EKM49419.1 hypothetical protein PHACADRAFT_167243 [Phanerochaete carnosa HHB-10118-sp]
MALSTISSLNESFTSAVRFGTEKYTPLTEKEKQNSEEDATGDAAQTNEMSSLDNTLPAAMNVNSPVQDLHAASKQEPEKHSASELTDSQKVTEGDEAPSPMDVQEDIQNSTADARGVSLQQDQNASSQGLAATQGRCKECRGAKQEGNDSEEASSGDEPEPEVCS